MATPFAKIQTAHWPYALEIIACDGGLLLRPKKKARAGWSKLFQKTRTADHLADVRSLKNNFDEDEWQW